MAIGALTATLAALPTVCAAPMATAPTAFADADIGIGDRLALDQAVADQLRSTSGLSANLPWFSRSPVLSLVRSSTVILPAFPTRCG